jgi:hypothetical protein
VRRLIVLVVVLAVALVALDRVALVGAERAIANRIQSDQHLDQRPDVTIRGFPFLSQAVAGDYDEVDVKVAGLHAGRVAVERVSVRLRGVHVSLGDVVAQHVSRVPVDHATAELFLSYRDLEAHAGVAGLRFSQGAHDRVHVEASVGGLGVSGDVPVTVDSGVLTIAVGHGLDVHVPLGSLPFRLHLTAAKSTRTGLLVAGTADGLVLQR